MSMLHMTWSGVRLGTKDHISTEDEVVIEELRVCCLEVLASVCITKVAGS